MNWQLVYSDSKIFLSKNWKKVFIFLAVFLFLLWTWAKVGDVDQQNQRLRKEIVDMDKELDRVRAELSNKEREVETLKEGGSEAVASVERLTEDKSVLQARVKELKAEVVAAKGKFGIQVGPNLSQEQLDANVLRWVSSARSNLADSALDVLTPQQKNQVLDRAAEDLRKARASLNQDSDVDLLRTIDQLASAIGLARPPQEGGGSK